MMQEFRVRTSHKPHPLPAGRWAMTQRWNDLLFAHWPLPVGVLAPLLPEGLQVDTFHGSGWLGVAPFWIDRIKVRGVPLVARAMNFPALSLRTYVCDQRTGTPGVYFFSLDAGSLLAVAAAHIFYRLPYHWAEMRMEQRSEREFAFYSRRRLSSQEVVFKARYRGLGPTQRLAEGRAGTLESFLMERHCMFTHNQSGEPIRANIHTAAWPLEEAEAQIERNDLASSLGIKLPDHEPVLHYARRMAIYVWPQELVRQTMVTRPVTVAATPSG